MKFFYTTAPVGVLFPTTADWESSGFDVMQVRQKNKQVFGEDGVIHSFLPIANETAVNEKVARFRAEMPENTFTIMEEAEANAEFDRLFKLAEEARIQEEKDRASTPTDEDIFRAQQLLLLTEIKAALVANGGNANV